MFGVNAGEVLVGLTVVALAVAVIVVARLRRR